MTCITRSSEMEIVKLHRMPMSKNMEGSKEEGKKRNGLAKCREKQNK